MRVKLKTDQLNKLAQRLAIEVIVQQPRDVRGLLEILGRNMPWDETGLSKFSDPPRKPVRFTFSVESTKDGYICDIHPALAHYLNDLLASK